MIESSRSRILLWSVVLLLAIGCATPDTEPTGPSARRAIVAPVNFGIVTANQLEPGLRETDRLVQLFLRHRGLEVERVPLGRFTSLWQIKARAVSVPKSSRPTLNTPQP